MTTFYEFQQQFPDDEACLKRIMVERYGGTELDCPKCGGEVAALIFGGSSITPQYMVVGI